MNRILITIFILISCSFSVLAQQGVTWGPSGDIATMSFDNMHPRVVMDRSGDPMVIWGKMADKSVYFSRWNGTSFSVPAKINPMGMDIATADWMGPDIASFGDTLYVVVKRTPEAADTNRIFIFSSFNGGTTFNPPVELALIADSISRFPTVTTDALGNPIIAFMKFNSVFMDSRWAITRSNDYGATFSTDVKASGWGGSGAVCDCCPGAVVSHGDTTLMLYRNNDNNVRDMWTGISSDNAATFSTGLAIDNNNWMIMMCPSSGPDGIVVNDTLYSVFMNGASSMNRTYLSKTDLSSGTLSSVSMLANPTGLSLQNFPRIAGDGNAIAIVWRQVVNGTTELPIYFTNNISTGFSAAYDSVDLNNITNADVAMRNGKIVVVWQDDNTGTVKYRTGAYMPFNTSISEINEQGINIFPSPASDLLNISFRKTTLNRDITILNILGEVIYYENEFNASYINISNLNRGIYFVRVTTADQSFTRKFIKE